MTIVSTQKLRECQDFVDKVGEIRFNKVKLRQLTKLNLLTIRKEGNITRFHNTNTNNLASHNLNNSQTNLNNSQVNLPPGEGLTPPQANPPTTREGITPSQANTPPREGTSPSQANTTPPGEASTSPATALPPREASASLATALPLGEASAPLASTLPLPPTTREGITPSQANTHPREGTSPSQANTTPPREASAPLATALPPREASTPPASTLPLPPTTREGIIPSQANTHSYSLRSTQSGQASNTTRASRQGNRCPPPIGPPRLPRRLILPPRKVTLPSPCRHPQGSSNEEPNPRWVINLSNKPLTPAQRSVLAKGPNFAVIPRQPPNLEYITAIEAACTKLSQQDAEELRADINRVLRSSHPPKPNLTKAQNIALRELKRDRDHIVLTADKGVAMVVMDRQDYINKANQLLNQNTYKVISKDPINTIKNKLINILKNIKTKSGLGTNTYKSMYPTGCVPPKFYGLPKIHKPDTPLRPIVSSCGSVTYGMAKELAKILKPLVGKSPHHINSTQDFVEQARQFKLEPGECLSSYDVSALFTSVPIDPALNIIKDLLDKDTTLKERTVMEVGDIILLLEFCLKNTYFSFQGQFYEQVEGAAMGSPVSPIVANLYMEYLEQKALSTAPHPPGSGAGL